MGTLLMHLIRCLFVLVFRYIGLHTAYYNEGNVLVTHPLYTARHYFGNGFFFDLLCCFPFEMFTYFLNRNEQGEYKIMLSILVSRVNATPVYTSQASCNP